MRYIVVLLGILILFSCEKKAKAPIKKDVFKKVLYDVHFTDAVLGVSRYKRGFSRDDNMKYYNHIFKKYSITKADFDSSIVVYSKNLELYDDMYQYVKDSLNRLKSSYEGLLKEKRTRDTLNLWQGENNYIIKGDSVKIIEKDIPFNDIGEYTFSLRIKVRKGDKGKNNRITGYFTRLTKSGNDTIIPLDTVKMRKDTIWRYYRIRKFAADSLYKSIHFKILDCDNLDSLKHRDVEIKDIKLQNPLFEGDLDKYNEHSILLR